MNNDLIISILEALKMSCSKYPRFLLNIFLTFLQHISKY